MFQKYNAVRIGRLIGCAAVLSTMTACEAINSITEPTGEGDLVTTAIQLAEATGTQTARAKVSTPMRFRVTVKNEGISTMAATRVRVSARFGPTLGDIEVPRLGPGKDVTVEANLTLPSQMISTSSRNASARFTVEACANVTRTDVEKNESNNCLRTQGDLLIVQPNFELDCGATLVESAIAQVLAGSASRCNLGNSGSWSSVRFVEATSQATFRVLLERIGAETGDNYNTVVFDSDGAVVVERLGSRFDANSSLAFNASVPGRYYIATGGPSQYRKTVTRQ